MVKKLHAVELTDDDRRALLDLAHRGVVSTRRIRRRGPHQVAIQRSAIIMFLLCSPSIPHVNPPEVRPQR